MEVPLKILNPTYEVVSIPKGSILSDFMRITFCLVHRKLDDNIIINNLFQEEFEDTKGAIRNRTCTCISEKNRQHNGKKKKHKRTNNDRQNIHIKLKIE